MPIFLNRKTGQKLRKGKRKIGAVQPSRRISLGVRKAIVDSLAPLAKDMENLAAFISGGATEAQAAVFLDELQERWRVVHAGQAKKIAKQWVDECSTHAKKRLESAIARSLRVDMTRIFDDQTVADAAKSMARQSARMISNLPLNCLDKVQDAVLRNYQQLPLPGNMSLTDYLKTTLRTTQKRAHRIARDQTSKINASVNQARQQSIGIVEYEWVTAKDRRVVGTPGGEWPKGSPAHENHYIRHGVVFRWDSPPGDGHPGYAPGCRCRAKAVFETQNLRQIQADQFMPGRDIGQSYDYGTAA